MTIGERIKKIREFRGLTQKELGLAIGYDEKTARARISQYEINNRVPKEETLTLLANALSINVHAITNYALASSTDIMEYLFWLDEKMNRKGVLLYQTEPQKVNLQINTKDNDSPKVEINLDYENLDEQLQEWYTRKQQLVNGEISEQDYFEWIIGYPFK